jgi:alkylhydroperoxidase family enzyme
VGLKPDTVFRARNASAADAKTDAILKLARAIVVQRGEISERDFNKARQAGVTDGEVAELVANVALNIFTNYLNHVAQTEIDFPKVEPGVERNSGTTAIREEGADSDLSNPGQD